MNRELAMCAQINFENLEKAMPVLGRHPYYLIAKAQLDEALGGRPAHEKLALAAKTIWEKDGNLVG